MRPSVKGVARRKGLIVGAGMAGQWSYSPSGVPIALLTGRIAARAVLRALKG
jgi:hypothetical protein